MREHACVWLCMGMGMGCVRVCDCAYLHDLHVGV